MPKLSASKRWQPVPIIEEAEAQGQRTAALVGNLLAAGTKRSKRSDPDPKNERSRTAATRCPTPNNAPLCGDHGTGLNWADGSVQCSAPDQMANMETLLGVTVTTANKRDVVTLV